MKRQSWVTGMVALITWVGIGHAGGDDGTSQAARERAPATAPAPAPELKPMTAQQVDPARLRLLRRNEPPQRPPGGIKEPGPECDSTCLANVATVYRKSDTGSCRVWFRFACAPYGCDETAGLCRGSCARDDDCAQGSVCATSIGMCAAASAMCTDASTLRMPNGQVLSCLPYLCAGGACRNVCASSSDCQSGYSCNTSTGACMKPMGN